MSNDNDLLRRAEHHYDVHNFDDLYEFASSVCLRTMPELTTAFDDSPEAQLIRRVGVRGLGSALSINHRPNAFYFNETEDEEGEFVSPTTLLRQSDLFRTVADPLVQNKIEAFGQQLLNEAYRSLGADVDNYIHRFRQASSDSEQIEVLNWLSKRFDAMYRLARDGESGRYDDPEDGQPFYHPMRLSPKIMGQYPKHQTAPTCLSVSLLASSFFAKAGADSLHAGVMTIEAQTGRADFGAMCRLLSERQDVPFSDLTRQKLKDRARDMATASTDQSFHAASLVRLKSGAWYMFDPNYNACYTLEDKDAERVNTVYEELHDLQTVAPGLEEALILGGSGPVRILENTIRRLKVPDDSLQEQVIRLIFDKPEQLQNMLRHHVRKALNQATHPNEVLTEAYPKVLSYVLDREISFFGDWRYNTIYNEAFEEAYRSFFLYGEDAEAIAERARTDHAYLERRFSDLICLPYLTLLLAVKQYSRLNWDEEDIHDSIEIGLPAYRLGAAVLSDFASHCGNEMSYNFWLAHWPSLIPITEHAEQVKDYPQDADVLRDNLHWLDLFGLLYDKQNGIIKKSENT